MLTGELTVRGILQTRGVWVAMVSGPDNKVYTVRAGDGSRTASFDRSMQRR